MRGCAASGSRVSASFTRSRGNVKKEGEERDRGGEREGGGEEEEEKKGQESWGARRGRRVHQKPDFN